MVHPADRPPPREHAERGPVGKLLTALAAAWLATGRASVEGWILTWLGEAIAAGDASNAMPGSPRIPCRWRARASWPAPWRNRMRR